MAKKIKQDLEIIEEEGEENKKDNTKDKKTVLTLFLFLLPVLIMAYTQEFVTKFLLFCYLGILLVNFIRDKASSD